MLRADVVQLWKAEVARKQLCRSEGLDLETEEPLLQAAEDSAEASVTSEANVREEIFPDSGDAGGTTLEESEHMVLVDACPPIAEQPEGAGQQSFTFRRTDPTMEYFDVEQVEGKEEVKEEGQGDEDIAEEKVEEMQSPEDVVFELKLDNWTLLPRKQTAVQEEPDFDDAQCPGGWPRSERDPSDEEFEAAARPWVGSSLLPDARGRELHGTSGRRQSAAENVWAERQQLALGVVPTPPRAVHVNVPEKPRIPSAFKKSARERVEDIRRMKLQAPTAVTSTQSSDEEASITFAAGQRDVRSMSKQSSVQCVEGRSRSKPSSHSISVSESQDPAALQDKRLRCVSPVPPQDGMFGILETPALPLPHRAIGDGGTFNGRRSRSKPCPVLNAEVLLLHQRLASPEPRQTPDPVTLQEKSSGDTSPVPLHDERSRNLKTIALPPAHRQPGDVGVFHGRRSSSKQSSVQSTEGVQLRHRLASPEPSQSLDGERSMDLETPAMLPVRRRSGHGSRSGSKQSPPLNEEEVSLSASLEPLHCADFANKAERRSSHAAPMPPCDERRRHQQQTALPSAWRTSEDQRQRSSSKQSAKQTAEEPMQYRTAFPEPFDLVQPRAGNQRQWIPQDSRAQSSGATHVQERTIHQMPALLAERLERQEVAEAVAHGKSRSEICRSPPARSAVASPEPSELRCAESSASPSADFSLSPLFPKETRSRSLQTPLLPPENVERADGGRRGSKERPSERVGFGRVAYFLTGARNLGRKSNPRSLPAKPE
eukprot:TRINITY_DN17954_c0_g1_i1.p1 TRINITY_DN17954_c0_g1~~TRINITY_DN17954_c0_g1_i1.p1  ORF type:complete len:789 (-),score=75.11 TRINITY_DN17954_c0_g1_i1:260-2566(-)